MMYKFFFKRLVDILVSMSLLLVLLPIVVLLTIFLYISFGGNPFFIQARPGKFGKIFHIIKYKTMNDRVDNRGYMLPDAERLTSIGRLMRKLSMDEIPQLFNVLKGDMSLIGPRPLLVQYLSLYNDVQSRRHEVRPGITGWAQVNGRNAISWKEKFEFDVFYVDNVTLGLDLKIIYLTLLKVIKSDGITAEGHATTEAFKGN